MSPQPLPNPTPSTASPQPSASPAPFPQPPAPADSHTDSSLSGQPTSIAAHHTHPDLKPRSDGQAAEEEAVRLFRPLSDFEGGGSGRSDSSSIDVGGSGTGIGQLISNGRR
ncbi:unnamed protein product [Cuscuta europaea]|uniref:Uncharacterized protein n=1 Tax=Cuscuta europaea TaxID=41803 RepID=A0A9P0ZBS9_CUSEU|nr:unnamed protein product [Cuscuta europaea]